MTGISSEQQLELECSVTWNNNTIRKQLELKFSYKELKLQLEVDIASSQVVQVQLDCKWDVVLYLLRAFWQDPAS
jgi:hypothetical protein